MGEWKTIPIGILARGIRGVSYKPYHLRDLLGENDVVLLRSNNIQSDGINFNDIQIVPDNIVNDEQLATDGDILVCMSNGSKLLVGKNARYKAIGERHTVGSFCSLFRAFPIYDKTFVYYVFQSNAYKKAIDKILSGSAINNLHNSIIENININIPISLDEQRCIADILTAADEAITASRALVEKYAVVKLGLMRDLLGVGEKVSLRKLGGRFVRGQGITRADVHGEGIACIRYGELYTTYNIWLDKPKSYVSVELARHCLHVKHGDLLFTLSGETAEEIGKTVVYLGKEECVVGGDIAVFTGHRQNPLYLSYILNAPDALKQKELRATGSIVVHINSKKLEEISVPLPSLPEQQRIADILTAADTRLTTERAHLQKLENIKRGLMDDLLTNRVSTNSILHKYRHRKGR